jgi:hypothetical protein
MHTARCRPCKLQAAASKAPGRAGVKEDVWKGP